jgi:hypothetical protein
VPLRRSGGEGGVMNTRISKNPEAERIVGLRPAGHQPLDEPCELGYRCPVCKYELLVDGNYDERLAWSEYNGFLWCSVCNFDYPSCLCLIDARRATETFLKTVQGAIERAASQKVEP